MQISESVEWPARFLDLKSEIVSATTKERLSAAWNDVLAKLAQRTTEIAQSGSNFIPQVNFADLENLTPVEIDVIKRKGSVVIRNVVDSQLASTWKAELEECTKANPHTPAFPPDNKQFFALYWARPQVQARAHPNVLKAATWLNNLYHVRSKKMLEGVDLSVPLTYADRFRIRRPGSEWTILPPHMDGGGMERWEDKTFRRCYENILTGNWDDHDPYELEYRLDAQTSMYGQPNIPTVFRAFQGWLSMSETGPTQGTLRVFPDVQLSSAYVMLRPFFYPTVPLDSPDILDPKNWKFDISAPDFPGILRMGDAYTNPLPTPQSHPHLRLEETMTSIPKVNPGDMVFWHCDMIHSVETQHTGDKDSAVMYIPAVPKTPQNFAYVVKQAKAFLAGQNPPDFEPIQEGITFVGLGVDSDIEGPIGRAAMALPIEGQA